MTSNVKPGATAQASASRGFYRVAIVGAGSLKGKEVAEMLEQKNFPAIDVKLLDDDEALGQLEALKDEITFIQSVRSEQFDHIDFTFFASDADCTNKNWKQVQAAGSAIIDLSYALENEPGATLRAPWVQRQLGHVETPELQPGPAVIAHPVSVVLALLLSRLSAAHQLRGTVATIFEPASEHGQSGMDELHEQTVSLLSFQPLPKNLYDVQVAFNMVERYGDQAKTTLASLNERIVRHFKKIVPQGTPVPSVLVLQAPTFHSYSLSMNVRFEAPADITEISAALAGEHVTVIPMPQEPPNNVNAAGQGDILVSVIPDGSDPNAVWLWAAFDNLRVAAITAVECAEVMSASRPRGQVQ
ncbi:MAG TPA: Asd/ArgC dimerization domain-containing protein [Terriglobales bacterium]